jgi:hypothetical protein
VYVSSPGIAVPKLANVLPEIVSTDEAFCPAPSVHQHRRHRRPISGIIAEEERAGMIWGGPRVVRDPEGWSSEESKAYPGRPD